MLENETPATGLGNPAEYVLTRRISVPSVLIATVMEQRSHEAWTRSRLPIEWNETHEQLDGGTRWMLTADLEGIGGGASTETIDVRPDGRVTMRWTEDRPEYTFGVGVIVNGEEQPRQDVTMPATRMVHEVEGVPDGDRTRVTSRLLRWPADTSADDVRAVEAWHRRYLDSVSRRAHVSARAQTGQPTLT